MTHLYTYTDRRNATRLKNAALGSTALFPVVLCIGIGAPAQTPAQVWGGAASGIDCNASRDIEVDECIHPNADVVVVMPTGDNVERETINMSPGGAEGFSISINGDTMAGVDRSYIAGARRTYDDKRETDIALRDSDVQVQYDGLSTRPRLAVSTEDVRATYQNGATVKFRTSSNYPDWIKRAEITLYPREDRLFKRPLMTIPVGVNAVSAGVTLQPIDGVSDFLYVLRVYDAKGRYDETEPLSLDLSTATFAKHETQGPVVSAADTEDMTARRRIPVHGGSVTVYGRDLPQNAQVQVFSSPVPVDADGSFVVQRIIPPGEQAVDVAVTGTNGSDQTFTREIEIPQNEWFYVLQADVTLGHRTGDLEEDDLDDEYVNGRFAGYVKGRLKGDVILTAALDTGEEKLKDVLRNLDDKDPRAFLRRIDPDRYYTVYGDDSYREEDAPTIGRFYVRVERGDDYLMWGNFRANVTGSEFVRNDRTLYGAAGQFNSEATTSFGEPRVQVNAYGSEPSNLLQRDVLRGTGGSAYFLKRQDISIGSEIVYVELRDSETGTIRSRRQLVYGQDYDIDYFQGVIILRQPLSSTAGDGSSLVRENILPGDDTFLVVNYEYTPTFADVDGWNFGGRASVWVNDSVQLGFSGMKESSGATDYHIMSGDVTFRLTDRTYATIEYAESDGRYFGESLSSDGGFTLFDRDPVSGAGSSSSGLSVKLYADWQDLAPDSGIEGGINAYFRDLDGGFSSTDYSAYRDTTVWGVFGDVRPNEQVELRFAAERYHEQGGRKTTEVSADLWYQFDPQWQIALGAKYYENRDPNGDPDYIGKRTDLAVRITRDWSEDFSAYVFGQVSVDRSGSIDRNDRFGAGFDARISEKLSAVGELSGGHRGVGANFLLNYQSTADNQYYIGYRMDPSEDYDAGTLSGRDDGVIVMGATRRYSENLMGFAENNYDMFGRKRTMSSVYGVEYTPNTTWSLSGAAETGYIRDRYDENFDRTALSLTYSYHPTEDLVITARGEVRFEDSKNSDRRDRNTYAFSGGVRWQTSEDWRLIANVDWVYSKSDQSSVLNGEYLQASIGYAYRPVLNDRLNVLFKYTYLYDLPGNDQVSWGDNPAGFRTKDHILSADMNYDLNEQFTLGAKYGLRISKSADRDSDDYDDSTVHLGVLRMDYHVVHKWDILTELHVLHAQENKQTDWGGLVGVYRHLGNNFKIGVGYNFSDFSDDLRNHDRNYQGMFVNMLAKF